MAQDRFFKTGLQEKSRVGLIYGRGDYRVLKRRIRVMIEQDEDGFFVADVPTLPGCISQGKTRNEALVNIREAIRAYIDSLEKHGEPVPPPISQEIVEI